MNSVVLTARRRVVASLTESEDHSLSPLDMFSIHTTTEGRSS